MPCRDTRHEGRPGDACYLVEFVDYPGVGYVCRATELVGQIAGDQATEVARVAAAHFLYVCYHRIVDLIDATRNRAQQTAAPNHGIKFQRNLIFGQCV